MQMHWTDTYLVSSYDVDPQGRLPLPGLGRFLQESAYNHANHLEFGYDQLQDKKQFWVLSRLVIKVEKFPVWRDTIKVRTWGRTVEGLFAYRDFQVMDEKENIIAGASSGWLILDSEKRRPQRMTELQKVRHKFPENKAIQEDPTKLPLPQNPETSQPFPVRYSDLDLYNHVNNAKYMQWLMDGYPIEQHQQYDIHLFEINFLSEALYGDNAFIETQPIEPNTQTPIYLHCIRREADERPICTARISWKKKA